MQIALTKKLSDALCIKPEEINEGINPIFTWTANWTNVWTNRKTEDMLVLVNNATRFVVAVYQVKKKDLKNIEKIIIDAIEHTLLAMNLNPEIVAEYLRRCGKISFVKNGNRAAASWVTSAGRDCAIHVGNMYNGIGKMFSDLVGVTTNHMIVNYSKNMKDYFYPYEKMFEELSELTDLPIYKYQAYELLVTLDLKIYKAERRIIVPSDMGFHEFHKVLQRAFGWKNYHLYDFMVLNKNGNEIMNLVLEDENTVFYDNTEMMEGKVLKDYLYKDRKLCYRYDFGDGWEHEVKILKVSDDYDKESPYLLEAKGQTPPEDVGGVYGFIEFLEIIKNPKHPEYEHMKQWAGYWRENLSEWETKPRVLYEF